MELVVRPDEEQGDEDGQEELVDLRDYGDQPNNADYPPGTVPHGPRHAFILYSRICANTARATDT
jgi:hypothetical protein